MTGADAASDETGSGAVDGRRLALTALTVLFGIESLRALMPLVTFMLRDRFGWHAGEVGLGMMGLLATGFLAAPARRALGPRRFLLVAAGGLGLARLGIQAWTGDPVIDFGLTAAAVVFFFWALPALAGVGKSFVAGWLIGLAADTALHGVYGTWDISWRSDPASLATVLALVAVQWWLLASGRGVGRPADAPGLDPGWAWTALGPLLFLELLMLGNVARLAALTGWGVEAAALWALAGRIAACAMVAMAASFSRLRGARLGVAVALLVAAAISWPRGVPAALLLLALQVSAAMLWSWIVIAAFGSRSVGAKDTRRLAGLSHGVALLAFGVLLFAYYGGIDIRMPIHKDLLPPIAALAVGLAAITAGRAPVPALPRLRFAWPALAVLLTPGLIRLAAAPEVRAGDASGWPLKVMTYNLHLGVDPLGRLDLEQAAATIEAEGPDVVALQEVSRGWAINGSADVLSWLSRRLAMPYVFGPTADPVWGNAVLSRRPILGSRTFDLPSEGLLIRRGVLAVRLDVGEGEPFEVMVTHHHHRRRGGAVRELQSRAILDQWQSRGRTAIAGDFNGRPGTPEIEMLRAAGLADVLDLTGVEPGYTHSAFRPNKRIDYIWISPDLTAIEAAVPPSLASDHLPVVATLDFR